MVTEIKDIYFIFTNKLNLTQVDIGCEIKLKEFTIYTS